MSLRVRSYGSTNKFVTEKQMPTHKSVHLLGYCLCLQGRRVLNIEAAVRTEGMFKLHNLWIRQLKEINNGIIEFLKSAPFLGVGEMKTERKEGGRKILLGDDTGEGAVCWRLNFNWASLCGAVGWRIALQAGRSQVRFPMASLEFFIGTILPVALWSWARLSL